MFGPAAAYLPLMFGPAAAYLPPDGNKCEFASSLHVECLILHFYLSICPYISICLSVFPNYIFLMNKLCIGTLRGIELQIFSLAVAKKGR